MTPPPPDVIVPTDDPICWGDETTLTVSAYDPAFSYEWFWNGQFIGFGEMITADTAGLYAVEINNGCQVTEATYELEECVVTAVISCPLDPNACACEGDPITLSGCASEDSCDPGNPSNSLIYNWTANGVDISPGGCTITHTPPANMTTVYTLEVVNMTNGCRSQIVELPVTPCLKNE